MSVGVLNMHHIGPDLVPVPPWMKKHVLGTMSTLLMMPTVPGAEGHGKSKRTAKISQQEYNNWEQHELLSIVEGELHKSPRKRPRSCITCNGVSSMMDDNGRDRPISYPVDHGGGGSGSGSPTTASHRKQNELYIELLREVKKLTGHMEEGKADERLKNEWKRVALVFDRFFMVIFVIGTLCTYMIMFMQL